MYGEQIAQLQKALDPKTWPWPVIFWFMFDNHTFASLKGTPDEMGEQIKKYMIEDKYCGSVFARQQTTEKEIPELCLHGDYKNNAVTDENIKQWVETARAYV